MGEGGTLSAVDVSQAVDQRLSCRAFLDQPVDDNLLRSLVERAARAPSGGNVQPWVVYVITSDRMAEFQAHLAQRPPEEPEYDIYPPNLWDPHRTARYQLGEQMYEKLGIGRDDKPARLRRMMENYNFFGATAALFMYLDRRHGPPQWSDCGMYLQTFMLLAEEAGLSTCAQEIWSNRHQAVTDFVKAPDELMLFCGMAIGHADTGAPVNELRSERLPLDQFATFL